MKTLFRMLLLLVVAAGLLAAGGYWYLRHSLPQTTGVLRVAGLDAPIEILRDAYGIPHIYARSADDAYFALGFVHAQDRL